MFEIGSFVNHTYQVISEIGSGGTGVIYLAYHVNLQKYVVLKKIKDNLIGRIDARVEVDVLKGLHHPGLPQVYDFLEIDNSIYTVIDYIEGYDLSYYIANGYKLTEEELEDCLIQLLEVLEYLHSQSPQIIHSDIKPANIMIDKNGRAYLIDFNISFENEIGKVTGISEAYASYEQIEMLRLLMQYQDISNCRIDGRSDLYSLGAAMYHLITGVKPYLGIEEQYPIYNYEVPYKEALLMIIDRAMKTEPDRRYSSAREMRRALERIRRSTVQYRLKKAAIVLGSCVAAFMIAGVGLGLYSHYNTKLYDSFDEEYRQIVQASNEGSSVRQKASAMLEEDRYQRILNQNADKQADLQYLIASEYLDQQDYEQAIIYYKQAIVSNPQSIYYRDYAIALARSGNLADAGDVLAHAVDHGLGTYDMEEIQAEIDVYGQQYESAIQRLNSIITQSNEDSLKFRAMQLLVRCYDYTGDPAELISVLENAAISYEYQDSYYKLLIYAYSRNAAALTGDSKIDAYQKLIMNYEAIQDQRVLSQSDFVSIANAYLYTGQSTTGEKILLRLIEENPEDYSLYMQTAFYYYNMESSITDNYRNYALVKQYYDLAVQKYRKSYQQGNSDPEMNRLEQLMEDLINKGWLQQSIRIVHKRRV
ncbi:MAG: protein kinase [Lachnospiraceae bacterium]|nr:protein kinase [Lachnospiraceae bacterium]